MLPPVLTRRQTPQLKPLSRISRLVSSQQYAANAPKSVSPHIGFYKRFGKPVAKVLLMATFTYQLSYWLWVKLEKDEIKSGRQAEISALEAKLQDVISSTKRP